MGTSIRTGIIFSGGIIHEYIDCCEWGYALCFILFIESSSVLFACSCFPFASFWHTRLHLGFSAIWQVPACKSHNVALSSTKNHQQTHSEKIIVTFVIFF